MFEKWLRVTLVVALSLSVAGLAAVNADEPKKEEMKDVKADEKKADEKKADAEKKPMTAADKMEAARKAAIKSRDRIRSTNQSKGTGKGVRKGPQIPEPTVKLEPGQTPAIKFDTPIYDFGKVKGGTDVVHDFFFTNVGNGPLEILKVKPGCGCTKAGEHDRVVQPGATGKIPIRMNTKKGAGKVTKPVTVYTNIPGTQSQVRLQITGELWQPFDTSPRNAAFGRLTPDKVEEGMVRKLTLTNNLDDKMTPGKVTSTSENFTAEIKPIVEGKQYEITVTLVPPLTKGNNTGIIKIESGIEGQGDIEVRAYAFLTSPIDVSPAELVLTDTRPSELTRKFYINNNGKDELEITNLKSSNEKLKLEISDLRGNKKIYQLVVTIPQDYVAPPQGDTISFNTNNASMKEVKIPVKTRAVNRTAPRATFTPPATKK